MLGEYDKITTKDIDGCRRTQKLNALEVLPQGLQNLYTSFRFRPAPPESLTNETTGACFPKASSIIARTDDP